MHLRRLVRAGDRQPLAVGAECDGGGEVLESVDLGDGRVFLEIPKDHLAGDARDAAGGDQQIAAVREGEGGHARQLDRQNPPLCPVRRRANHY
jgi:hypothetical protein